MSKESLDKAVAKAMTPPAGYKTDTLGRSYKIDESGTRVYAKGSTRCPNTPYEVWKLMPPSARKLIWAEYLAKKPVDTEPAAEPACVADAVTIGRVEFTRLGIRARCRAGT